MIVVGFYSEVAPPSKPRALAYLVSRGSELAYLLRSLTKLSTPPQIKLLLLLLLLLLG